MRPMCTKITFVFQYKVYMKWKYHEIFSILSGLHNMFKKNNKVSVIREFQQQIPIYFSPWQGYLFSRENDE